MSSYPQYEHAQREAALMAELTALSSADLEYPDLVFSVLDVIEPIAGAPYLSLATADRAQVQQYAHLMDDADPAWAEAIDSFISMLQAQHLSRPTLPSHGPFTHHSISPPAWTSTFSAQSRSHHSCVLTLASPRPLQIDLEKDELLLRLVRHVLLVLDHALLLQHLDTLELTDSLTRVANQRQLLEVLEQEMRRHRYYGRPLALLVLDVEGLQGINRSYGHGYGDHILRKLATLLQQTVRPVDLVARCGLDEFAVVLPETDGEQGISMQEHIQERLLGVEFAGGTVNMTMGVAHINPDESLTAEGLLRRVEGVLAEAKRQERGWRALGTANRQGVSY